MPQLASALYSIMSLSRFVLLFTFSLTFNTSLFAVDHKAAPFLKQVEKFEEQAYLFSKELKVRLLDVSQPRDFKPMFKLSERTIQNSGVAVCQSPPGVFVHDGQTIYRIPVKGESERIISLSELKSADKDFEVEKYEMNYYFGASEEGTIFYSQLLLKDPPEVILEPVEILARIDLSQKKIDSLQIHALDIDVDPKTETVYAAAFDDEVIGVDFKTKRPRSLFTTHTYNNCQLSPDGRKLLLSGRALEEPNLICFLEIRTGKEEILPKNVTGDSAGWGDDPYIYICRKENELWRYDLKENRLERLFQMIAERPNGKEHWNSSAPVFSADRAFLCWRWEYQDTDTGFLTGYVLVDLKNNEYRLIENRFGNVQWALPEKK